ncbi:hypothetical protein [Segetibacter koreensis]|uniref:hypothetical protein n=1 Tax=Segetibacter koreensis TaxID=398037 RepID=UPI00036B24FE|nr:hypothetical protein [Segetibacter koreensis]
MTKGSSILQRVLVNHFYKVNAGLFIFGFFVLFGLPFSPLAFHLSIITGIIQSPVFLASVMVTWLLYNFKCIDYILHQLADPRQSFLFCLNSLSFKKLYLYMVYVQALVYLPVILYALAIVWLALAKQQYWCAIAVLLFNVIVVSLTALIYIVSIQKKNLFKARFALPTFNINISKPLFIIPLLFLWHDRKQMLFVTKIFSLLILFGFIKLYVPDRYDIRPLQLLLLITAASHSAIVFHIRAFEEEFLSFTKNLPITIISRFMRMSIMYTLLLLPEFLFVFKGLNVHFVIADYPQILLMGIALLCMFHVVLLTDKTDMEQLIRVVFAIIAACFFILLYDPGLLLPAAIMLLAFVLYNSYYYSYEKKYR